MTCALQEFLYFELEAHVDCLYDRIELYDGKDENSTLIGKLCNVVLPSTIMSTGHVMFMAFMSDASVQRKGFEAVPSTGDIFS